MSGLLVFCLRVFTLFVLTILVGLAGRSEAPTLLSTGLLGLWVAEWLIRTVFESGTVNVIEAGLPRLRRAFSLRDRLEAARRRGLLDERQHHRALEWVRGRERDAWKRTTWKPTEEGYAGSSDRPAIGMWLKEMGKEGVLDDTTRSAVAAVDVRATLSRVPVPEDVAAAASTPAAGEAPMPGGEASPGATTDALAEAGEREEEVVILHSWIPTDEDAAAAEAPPRHDAATGRKEAAAGSPDEDAPSDAITLVDDLEPPPPEPGLLDLIKANFMAEGHVQWAEALFTLFSLLAFATAVVTVGYTWSRWNPYSRFAMLVAGAVGFGFFARKVASFEGLEKTGRAISMAAYLLAPLSLAALPFLLGGRLAGPLPAAALLGGAVGLGLGLQRIETLALGKGTALYLPLFLGATLVAVGGTAWLAAWPLAGLVLLGLVAGGLSGYGARHGSPGLRLMRLGLPVYLVPVGLASMSSVRSPEAGAWCLGLALVGLLLWGAAVEEGAGRATFPGLPLRLQAFAFAFMGLAVLAAWANGGFWGNAWLLATAVPALLATTHAAVRQGSAWTAWCSAGLLTMVSLLAAGPDLGAYSPLVLVPVAGASAAAFWLRTRTPAAAQAYQQAAWVLVGYALVAGIVHPAEGLLTSTLLLAGLAPLFGWRRTRGLAIRMTGALAAGMLFGIELASVEARRAAGLPPLGFGLGLLASGAWLALVAGVYGLVDRWFEERIEAALVDEEPAGGGFRVGPFGWWVTPLGIASMPGLLLALLTGCYRIGAPHLAAPGTTGMPGYWLFALGAGLLAVAAFLVAERGPRWPTAYLAPLAALAAGGLAGVMTGQPLGGAWAGALGLSLGLLGVGLLLATMVAISGPGGRLTDPMPAAVLAAGAFLLLCTWFPEMLHSAPHRGVMAVSLALPALGALLARGAPFAAWLHLVPLTILGVVWTAGGDVPDVEVRAQLVMVAAGVLSVLGLTRRWRDLEVAEQQLAGDRGPGGAYALVGMPLLATLLTGFVAAEELLRLGWQSVGMVVECGTGPFGHLRGLSHPLLTAAAMVAFGVVMDAGRTRERAVSFLAYPAMAFVTLGLCHPLPAWTLAREVWQPLTALGSVALAVLVLDRWAGWQKDEELEPIPHGARSLPLGLLAMAVLSLAGMTLLDMSPPASGAAAPFLTQVLATLAAAVCLLSSPGRGRALITGLVAVAAGAELAVPLVGYRVDHRLAAVAALGALLVSALVSRLARRFLDEERWPAVRLGFLEAGVGGVAGALLLVARASDWSGSPDLWVALAALIPALAGLHLLDLAVREQREALVWLGEICCAGTYVYLRATGILGVTMWGQVVLLVVSFGLLGVATWTREGRADILARPFRRTALVLPGLLMLRLLLEPGTPIDWKGWDGWGQFTLGAGASAFYALAARLEGRAMYRYLSGMAAYVGYALLFSEGFGMDDAWRHLDFYLVPLGLLLVLFSYLESRNLLEGQQKSLRTLGLLIVYFSPAAHSLVDATAAETLTLIVLGVVGACLGIATGLRLYLAFGLVSVVIGSSSFLLNILAMETRNFALLVFTLLAALFGGYSAWARSQRAEMGLE